MVRSLLNGVTSPAARQLELLASLNGSTPLHGTASEAQASPADPPAAATPMDEPIEAALLACSESSLSDTGNAERLRVRFGNDVLYVPGRGWHIWTGHIWAPDMTDQLVALAQAMAAAIADEADLWADPRRRAERLDHSRQSLNAARIRAAIAMAQPHCTAPADSFDQDPMLLACGNGTLDLATGQLRAPQREDRITRAVPFAYDATTPCAAWERFLDEICNGDAELVAYLQRAIGYTLTGNTREHALFVLEGPGANGKTTLLEILGALLGSYAGVTPAATLMAKRFPGIPNDLARLEAMRFVRAAETDRDVRMSESFIKLVTGGDRVAARFLYGEYREFRPAFKLWLGTNHRPKVDAGDAAVWRRLRIVPLHVRFVEPGSPDDGGTRPLRDPTLPVRLLEELPGIFAWAVRGCLEWQRCGLNEPPGVRTATDHHRTTLDTVSAFLAACTVRVADPRARVAARGLYALYQRWCADLGVASIPEKAFKGAVESRGVGRIKSGNIAWTGLELNALGQVLSTRL